MKKESLEKKKDKLSSPQDFLRKCLYRLFLSPGSNPYYTMKKMFFSMD